MENQLSPREKEVIQLMAEGDRSKEIAAKMNIHQKDVENIRHHLYSRWGIRSSAHLISWAYEHDVLVKKGKNTKQPRINFTIQ